MAIPLIEKYRAKNLSEILGQDLAILEIKTFLKTFPKKKAVIINGPAGTGKTSIALALAKEYDYELFELNASDLRNKTKLEEILKPATEQTSLFKRGKLILMDEADGITTTDRGGLGELITLIEKTNFPIIITTNDVWDNKFSLLRKKCVLISLKQLEESIILEILERVLKNEKKSFDQKVLSSIAKNSKGDMRAALNDLQLYVTTSDEELKYEDSNREKEENIFDTLKKIFQYPTDKNIINIYDNVDLEINEISLWIEENISLEYQGKGLFKAFESLSKSDIFKGRIYRQQYWRFLVYQNFFLTAGISCATKIKYRKFSQYKRPSRILQIWLSNQKNAKKKSIISKYAQNTHISKKKAAKEYFLLPLIIDKQSLYKKLKLEDQEIAYLSDKKAALIIAGELNKFRT
jgi:replication factor C large subunit